MRIAQGLMSAEQFLEFLSGGASVAGAVPTTVLGMLALALVGGLAMNLTPCVLPMIPINLMVIGKSAKRGALYGLGMALAYGTLGVAASVGGLAFGEIQGNPWFNLGVAVVFVLLGLALLEVFFIDLSRFRPAGTGVSEKKGWFFPLAMGALSAVLAGACVAPILIAVLLLTADLFARGHWLALGLPFVLGLGMALPWPFAGAGLRVLPKPGGWMRWVNRLFAVLVFGFAVWYGILSYRGFAGAGPASSSPAESAISIPVADLQKTLATAKRPVLVDCWATWCKNCAAMERVLAKPEVRKELEGWTVLRVQAEDLRELLAQPGFEKVRGLPAFAVIP